MSVFVRDKADLFQVASRLPETDWWLMLAAHFGLQGEVHHRHIDGVVERVVTGQVGYL